jgi:V8-like Glu-specific endopeptidase
LSGTKLFKIRPVRHLALLSVLALTPRIAVAQAVSVNVGGISIDLKPAYSARIGIATTLNDLGLGSRPKQIERALSPPNFPKGVGISSADLKTLKEITLSQEKQSIDYQKVIAGLPIGAQIQATSSAEMVTQEITKSIQGQKLASTIAPVVRVVDPDDGIKRADDKTVYGVDNRMDYYQIPDQQAKRLAKGVASISVESLKSVPAQGMCTAFLVSPSVVITASHCVNANDFKIKVVRFNDLIIAAGPVPASIHWFEIASLLVWDHAHDLAVLELKRDAEGKQAGDLFPILTLSRNVVNAGKNIFVVGHAGYSFQKYGTCSVVKAPYFKNDVGKHTFGIDCTIFGGYSGSPVIDLTTDHVVGIVWGGQKDAKVYPSADPVNGIFEYAVPMDTVATASTFDLGRWPAALQFQNALDQKSWHPDHLASFSN